MGVAWQVGCKEVSAHSVPYLVEQGCQACKLICYGVLAILGPKHVGQRVLLARDAVEHARWSKASIDCRDALLAEEPLLRVQIGIDACLGGRHAVGIVGAGHAYVPYVGAGHVGLIVVGVGMANADEMQREIVEHTGQ